MSGAELAGLIVAVAVLAYLLRGAAAPGALLAMTVAGWIEILLFLALLTALTPLLGGYMARVFRGEAQALASSSARCTACWASTRRAARTGRATPAPCWSSARCSASCSTWSCARRACTRGTRRTCSPHVGPVLQHRRVVRDQHELAVLRRRDDALELLADGRPGRPELRLRRRRHRRRDRVHPRARVALGQGDRRLLRRPRPRDALRPAAALGRSSGSCSSPRASSRRSAGPSMRPPHRAHADLRLGPVASRRRSRCSAPTAAASSTSTRRCRSRTRRGSRTSSRCWRSCVIPAGLTATYGRMVDNRRQGWMVFGAMMTLFVVAVAVIYVAETGPTPAMQAAGLDRRQPRGQGACASASARPRCSPPSRPPPPAARSTPRWSR